MTLTSLGLNLAIFPALLLITSALAAEVPTRHLGFGTTATEDRMLCSFFLTPFNSPTTDPVTISFRTLSGTAISGVDFHPVSGTATFAPGDPYHFEIPMIDDGLVEGSESFLLEITDAPPDIPLRTFTLSIPDDERGYNFWAGEIWENDGFIEIHAARFGDFDFESTLDIQIEPGTARPGADYVDQPLRFVFPPGSDVRQTIRLPLINNSLEDGNRDLTFRAINPTPVLPIEIPMRLAVIQDNELGYHLEHGPRSLAREGNFYESAEPFVTVHRIGDYGESEVSVTFAEAIFPNLAKAISGLDFNPVTTSLRFAPGQSSARLPLPIINDTESERIEAFDVLFATSVLSPSITVRHQLKIHDNDFNPLALRDFCPAIPATEIAALLPTWGGKFLALRNTETTPPVSSILRLLPNGEVDPTFPPVLLDSFGKNLFAQPGDYGFYLLDRPDRSTERLRRFNSDGTVDLDFAPVSLPAIDSVHTGFGLIYLTTIGDQSPSELFRVGAPSNGPYATFTEDPIRGLAVADNGRVFVDAILPLDGSIWPTPFLLGGDGVLDRRFCAQEPATPQLAMGGLLYASTRNDELIRFLRDGSVDPSFARVPLGRWSRLFPHATGFYLLAENDGRVIVERYTAQGQPDPSFVRGIIDQIPTSAFLADDTLILRGDFPRINGAPNPCSSFAKISLRPVELPAVEPGSYEFREDAPASILSLIRTGPNSAPGQIRFRVRSGSARAGEDFLIPTEGQISFAAGESRQALPFEVINDSDLELENRFYIDFLNDAGGVISTSEIAIHSEDIGIQIVRNIEADLWEVLPINNNRSFVRLRSSATFQSWDSVLIPANKPLQLRFNGSHRFYNVMDSSY